MKKAMLFLPLLLLLSLTAHCEQFISNAVIDDIFCGEIDPYILNDHCLVLTTTDQQYKVAVLFGVEQFLKYYQGYDSMVGKQIFIDDTYYQMINNQQILQALKRFDSNYYYLDAMHGNGPSIQVID